MDATTLPRLASSEPADILADRSNRFIGPDGEALPTDDRLRDILDVIDYCEAHGLPARVVYRWVWCEFPGKPARGYDPRSKYGELDLAEAREILKASA